jgi:hypothetical protein
LQDPGQPASVGLPAEMEGADPADDFIAAGLAALGIETDEVERAVISAAHEMFWQPIRELLAIETESVVLERNVDLSRAPGPR